MEKYKLFIKKSVYKDIKKIQKNDLQKIILKIKSLTSNPFPLGSEKLTGFNLYRLRQGNYRIIYKVEKEKLTIIVIKIGHRKDVYFN